MTKEERRAYQMEYRKNNKDRMKAYNHAYWEKNKDKIMADRASKPEKRRGYHKEYYQAHKNDPGYAEKAKAYHAEWQRNNKEHLKEYRREWRKKKRLEAILAYKQTVPMESVSVEELALPQNIRGAIDERE